MLHRPLSAVTAGAALSTPSLAVAALLAQLPPGGEVSLTGTTLAEDSTLAGIIADERSQAFECGDEEGTLKGTFVSRVVRNKKGTLDFYYRVINAPDSSASVTVVGALREPEPFPWLASTFLVEFRADGVGEVGPTTAQRTPDGGALDFLFGEGVGPGGSSRLLLVRPGRTSFADGGEVVVSDGVRTCIVDNALHPL
jgi:hypothetical protein